MLENKEDFNAVTAHYSFEPESENPGWNLQVKKVAVILSSSRSGSSLVKDVIEKHKDIASLDGEIDPYLNLSGNGYPYTSGSDFIGNLTNNEMLLNNVYNNLGVNTLVLNTPEQIKERFLKRFVIQFPELFLLNTPVLCEGKKNYPVVVERIDKVLLQIATDNIKDKKSICDIMLTEVFPPELRKFFDGYKNDTGSFFAARIKIEEPPFVIPSPYKRPFNIEDVATKTLLFKTPQDAYRPGMYEQLFPNAEIKYIHLTRNCAETVNGLMDGWLSPIGFFSHNLEARTGKTLAITGYSDVVPFGKSWWKFDLPYNWQEYIQKSLEEVCLNQWKCAHQAILANYTLNHRVKFENYRKNPQEETDKILEAIGLSGMSVPKLPVIMATQKPDPTRWLTRKNIISPLLERAEIKALMNNLGYGKGMGKYQWE